MGIGGFEQLRVRLLASRERLGLGLNGHQRAINEHSEQSGRCPDPLEGAGSLAVVQGMLPIIELERDALRQTEQALVNIREGTYGTCAVCQGEIGRKRLRAVPFALLCVICQNKEDVSAGTRTSRRFPSSESRSKW